MSATCISLVSAVVRADSAICAYCNELVTVCSLHSVTVTSRRPKAKGLARQITEPTSASGGRAGRQIPARRQDLSYSGGSHRDEIGLSLPATRQRLGRLAPVWLPSGRRGVGIRTLSSAPDRGTYCPGVHFMGGTDLDAPRSQTVRAPVVTASDRSSPGRPDLAGTSPGQARRTCHPPAVAPELEQRPPERILIYGAFRTGTCDQPGGWGLCLWVPRTSSSARDQATFVDQTTGASQSSDAVLLKIDRFG